MLKIFILALRIKRHTLVDFVLYFFLWLIQRAFQIEDLYWKELFIIKVVRVFFTVVTFFIIQRIQSDKVKTLLSSFLKVRKLVSPIHNRSKNGDESDYSKKLIGWLRWGDSTNELHFWPQYTRVLFLIATFVIRLIHVCSAKSPLPQSKNLVLHVTRWQCWFMTGLLKQK